MDTNDLQKKGSKAGVIAAEEASKAAEKAKGLGAEAFSLGAITKNPIPVAVIGALLIFLWVKEDLFTAFVGGVFAAAVVFGVVFGVVFLSAFLPRVKAEVLDAPVDVVPEEATAHVPEAKAETADAGKAPPAKATKPAADYTSLTVVNGDKPAADYTSLTVVNGDKPAIRKGGGGGGIKG